VLLPVLVLLVVNVAVLLIGVFPLGRSVTNAADEAANARLDLANARRLEVQAKAQRDGTERAVVEMRKFYDDVLPASFAEGISVTNFWLQGVAAEYGVKFRTGQWEPEEVRDSRLTQLTGMATLTGDYSDIRKFLYHVETAEQFVVIESVELSQANLVEANADIEVTLKISTFYLAPEVREARTK
jgi:hypothetical protein